MSSSVKLIGTLFLSLTIGFSYSQHKKSNISFEFYQDAFNFQIDSSLLLNSPVILSEESIKSSYNQVIRSNYHAIISSLISYKLKHHLNDWLYYQLIRKTVQEISPKKENYERYTFYKWFFLVKSGYDARLTIADQRIILYVFNDESIADIPFVIFKNKKYMCLNYHDYAYADLNKIPPSNMISIADAKDPFSYKVTMMPDFKPESYSQKNIKFNYRHKTYHFNIKLNTEVPGIFANYPGVDFEYYFNIPLSKETYGSLIPVLRNNLKGMKQKRGVDYLMRFTRYAFLYEDDDQNFGKEKRLSPEETLFSKYSDCDDRVALFFYLVKEIYNLPMIAMLYPKHITLAIQFDKPVGEPIIYLGNTYSVCEPTPQLKDLNIGQLSAELKNKPYQVVYCYKPENK